MGIIQTSEKLIRSKFPTLDVYQNKKLSHFESDLFIKFLIKVIAYIDKVIYGY